MDLTGQIVADRYLVEHALGAGAMGTVYRARHMQLGRHVAVKVLHGHLLPNETMRHRFEREARIAGRLRHLNVIGVLDLGHAPDGRDVMILELAPGRCLADMMTAPMKAERIIALVTQLLRGLDHAHGFGLVHRDLKPENILVEETADGEVPRIVDFGIAVLRDSDGSAEGRRLTTAGMLLGTPMYMSPEHARGNPLDHRSDLFALGVIVYQMLAGCAPFDGGPFELLHANVSLDAPSILERAGVNVNAGLEAFARKLMARDMNRRFASAHDALIELARVGRTLEARSARQTAAQTTRWRRPQLAPNPGFA